MFFCWLMYLKTFAKLVCNIINLILHIYTSPGLAWDACLMFEKGIRGGITHISKRYAEANNKYTKDYNPDKPSSFISYLDANNLYGWAMSQRLPTHGFKRMKNFTVDKVKEILNQRVTNSGYIFEVDLEYPEKLWELHNDYPLAPEKLKVDNPEKIVGSSYPKSHYVLHCKNLNQYLSLGMKQTAVHSGISFYQSPWMKPYISKNTELRKAPTNSFEKDFCKLMNNSVFGKTIENLRKRQNVTLIDSRKEALKLSTKPNFDHVTMFDPHLIAVHMKKTEFI